MKMCIMKNWLNGFPITLNVPSTYHTRAISNKFFIVSVLKIMWRFSPTMMSSHRKFGGI